MIVENSKTKILFIILIPLIPTIVMLIIQGKRYFESKTATEQHVSVITKKAE
jgi:hypothetical protein